MLENANIIKIKQMTAIGSLCQMLDIKRNTAIWNLYQILVHQTTLDYLHSRNRQIGYYQLHFRTNNHKFFYQ